LAALNPGCGTYYKIHRHKPQEKAIDAFCPQLIKNAVILLTCHKGKVTQLLYSVILLYFIKGYIKHI